MEEPLETFDTERNIIEFYKDCILITEKLTHSERIEDCIELWKEEIDILKKRINKIY